MNKSLILFENNKFKNLFKSKKFLFFKGDSYDILKGNIYNPPFFKNIFFENPTNEKDIKIVWNSLLINGYLIIPLIFSKYISSDFKNVSLLNKKYAIFKKVNNVILTIYDEYRVFDFIIAGVEKGGTTSLHFNLDKHSELNIAKPKHHPGEELHYFDYHIMRSKRSKEWFQSHFDYNYKLVGYKNPNLIYLNYTHNYISSINPHTKLIIVLRNPIDRAYSEWYMFNHLDDFFKKNYRTFEEAIEEELKYRLDEIPNFYMANRHHLQKGLYYKQIKNLLKYFPIQNICFILNEELKNNEIETYEKIYKFLNIKIKHPIYEKKLEGQYNKNKKNKDINNNLKNKMINFFKKDVQKLENLINIKTNWF